jgi:GNAT superfamily N-acetyltransferase
MNEIKEISLNNIIKINQMIPEMGEETIKSLNERLNGKKYYAFGNYYKKNLVGYLLAYEESKKKFYVWLAGTIPEYRRKGVMKALMDYVEKMAKEKGFKIVKIKTKNSRRAQLFNLIKREYNITSVEEKEIIKENKINLEKRL